MRNLITLCCSLFLIFASIPACNAEIIGGTPIQGEPSVTRGPDISAQYLHQARLYREDGRYELSRQSYVQALSTCRNNANLEIIRRELAGVELLIRTMR